MNRRLVFDRRFCWLAALCFTPEGIAAQSPTVVQAHAREQSIAENLKSLGGGIRRDAEGRIVEVQFNNGNMPPKNPNRIAKLLTSLPDLREVTLRGGERFTDRGIRHFKRLTKLESLDVIGTSVTDEGVKDLVGLKHLTWLELGSTKITDTSFQYLRDMPSIEALDVSLTNVTDKGIESLKGHPRLAQLGLTYTKVSHHGLKHLVNLQNLVALDISGIATDEMLSAVKHMRKLRVLRVDLSSDVSDAGLAHLAGLVDLEELSLRGCPKITDAGMIHLAGLVSLKTIHVGLTKVTDKGKELLRTLPDLKTLKDD